MLQFSYNPNRLNQQNIVDITTHNHRFTQITTTDIKNVLQGSFINYPMLKTSSSVNKRLEAGGVGVFMHTLISNARR
jgi:hypothetical protein